MSSAISRSSSVTIASASSGPEPRCRGIYISPASLNLERLYEQNRQRQQKKDGVKAPELTEAEQAKGKPRLLLMGQRRYICHILTPCSMFPQKLMNRVGAASHPFQASSSTSYLRPRPCSSSQPPAYRKTALSTHAPDPLALIVARATPFADLCVAHSWSSKYGISPARSTSSTTRASPSTWTPSSGRLEP